MIKVENLYKGYGKKPVLKNISFQVNKGEIHGIIGRNGSGKTTLIKCLTGIYIEDSGSVQVCGERIYDNISVKQKVGYVADRNEYFPHYRVHEIVELYDKLYDSFSKSDFMDYNEAMGIDMKQMIKKLSKGQKMRLALILNLAIHPEVLILDEPMEGIDVIAKRELMDFIIREVEERDMSVVITSHQLTELENFCDSLTIIQEGKIVQRGSLDDLRESVKKLQVVMKKGLPKGFEQWSGVLHYSNLGSIYTIVWKDFNAEKEEALRLAGADLIEEIPISLEEIFLYEEKRWD